MHFHPSNVQFYGGGCKVLNYYNLKHSPAHAFPKDTRDSWLKQSQYTPPVDPPKTKSNCKYTELYNTREQYIHQSQKITAPSYSFGKAGMEENDFYKKIKKNKKRAKSATYKNIQFKEDNLEGDNCINNNDNNNKKEKKEKDEDEIYHQYYEIGKQFVNKSSQIKAPLYSFAGGEFGTKFLTSSRINNNFSPKNDFYELRKAYIKESKKPKILGYSFGKEKRLEPYIQTKKQHNKKNKNNFKEENNFNEGDNAENNNDNNNNSKKEEKKLNLNISKENPHDYYNLNEHYIYESQKPRVLGYSFGKYPRMFKGKKSKETFFYNLNDHYIYESQKPKAPNYSFGRPKSSFFNNDKGNNKNNKNKNNNRIKIRPKSAIYNNKIEEEKITPGPGMYDIPDDFGINGLKISMSKSGRKNEKPNGVPGANYYYPDYKVTKFRYPIYSIGNAEREGCYYPYNYYYKKRRSYGSQYYRKNPNWIFAKTCKGEDLHKKVMKENFRYL